MNIIIDNHVNGLVGINNQINFVLVDTLIKGLTRQKMKKKPINELKSSINHLTFQINLLKKRIETCEDANRSYNRLLIERACARKKLENLQTKSFISFLSNKIKINKGKPKYICDYFAVK